MTYKELHPAEAAFKVSQIRELFASVKPERDELIIKVLEEILEDTYATGHDDGVELMRDPAYSQEHV